MIASPFVAYPLRLWTRFSTFSSTTMHADLLRDGPRTLSFRDAIHAAVRPGMRVLDLGSGSGLLGLWALQAGASHVDFIDASTMAETLLPTLAANGFTARATVHARLSTEVRLAAPVDVVIAEVLGHVGIDEGILPVCHDARQRFAKADAPFIPGRVRVTAWPVWVPDFETSAIAFWNAAPYGFDFTAINAVTRSTTYACEFRMGQRLTDDGVLAEHIVGDAHTDDWHGEASFVAPYPSSWNGFFMSFAVDLGNGIELTGEASETWKPLFLPAPKVARVRKGDTLTLSIDIPRKGRVRYNGTHNGEGWAVTV